jgi:hypothetical protein
VGLYEGEIRQIAPQEDPKHVEAWLRLGNPGLHLCSKPQLEREIEIAVDAMQHSRLRRGRELAETLAPR